MIHNLILNTTRKGIQVGALIGHKGFSWILMPSVIFPFPINLLYNNSIKNVGFV
jgi:hypothetical protein